MKYENICLCAGPDWKDDYEYQDGGPGCVGVVIRKNDQGMVKVRVQLFDIQGWGLLFVRRLDIFSRTDKNI